MTTIRMIGVPLDFGASRRGVDMGPAALRIAQMAESLQVIGHSVTDVGDIPVPQRATIPLEVAGRGFLPLITRVCEQLADETADAIGDGEVPLVLGGDHSLVAGSFAGAARHFAARGEPVGCLYLDTHGDLHTPGTSLTGNVHGMPLAHLLGHGDERLRTIAGTEPALSARHLALVGIRDLDEPGEAGGPRLGDHLLHDARHRRARAPHRDAAGDRRRHRVVRPALGLVRHGLDRPRRRARRGHAGAWRRHLP
jgi:arginase